MIRVKWVSNNKSYFLFIFLFFFFLQKGKCTTTHFFVEIKKNKIEVGIHSEKNLKKKVLQTFPKDKINLDEILKIVSFDENENILLYIHGIWGHLKPYHKNTLKRFGQLKGVDKTISIIWHPGGLRYKPAWKRTINKGKIIAPILQTIVSRKNNKYFLLCHSMGHRLLEGAISEMNLSEVKFQTIFFAAPDLDIDVFSKKLSDLPSIANKMILYNHKRDRLLKVSKIVHRRERLGLNAIDDLESFIKIENLEVRDITRLKKGSGFSPTNHNYFKQHKTILKQISAEVIK